MIIQIQDIKVNTGIPGSEFVFEISSEAKIINSV
jgi:outer membrane lipoprotein-sorting protein